MSFKAVSSQIDFPALERELLEFWYREGIVEKYLNRNNNSDKKFSFLDGPITANNPMGVHHAWGRTYKDVFQRFYNMHGFKERFQNGFDEQGLWVEVEVEKELGLKTKKDILNLVEGDEYASLEKFVNLCKERVLKYSAVQTDQSKRLGYFMDWENSYHTSSEVNNYTIWNFLKVVNEKGWLYKGHDSVPWCPRCGTAISQHEILTEEYKELTHESVYFKLPLVGKENESLLVWTTTPWTIPANVAVAVNVEETYISYYINENEKVWIMAKAMQRLIDNNVLSPQPVGNNMHTEELKGEELVGLEYNAPFDSLERVKDSLGSYKHKVVKGEEQILPVSSEEGTGLVHVATGAGTEDFRLGQKLGLPVIEVIDEAAFYIDKLGEFSGLSAKKHPELIIDFLKADDDGKFLLTTKQYKHRYPTCWRCKTELVWRVVDEWYIAMDRKDESGKTYREQMMEVAKQINWMPSWGKERELDWLKNMHDWLISKKRFWGLALPIWTCEDCSSFEVIGGKEELEEKSVEGWDTFVGHTPHRPWIDKVKISCSKCQKPLTRIPDVGNPWLDAGIVPFSTLPDEWRPADFVTEGFPGQFKNWFYALIAMSTALTGKPPYNNLLGFGNLVDEKGAEMHKSSGNSIEFNSAADEAGVDPIRWLYATCTAENNLKFGFNIISDIKRRFYLILWNSYKFFVDYANLIDWNCELNRGELSVMDKWILARFTEVIILVNERMEKYDIQTAAKAIEDFVINDFSTWYIRRNRDKVGPSATDSERNTTLSVMYGILVGLTKVLAPFMPFISEEMYRNLAFDESVHLTDYPKGDKSLLNQELINDMAIVRQIVERGHSLRKEGNMKLRQPLQSVTYLLNKKLSEELEVIIAGELNVKKVQYKEAKKDTIEESGSVTLDTKISPALQKEGDARELIRSLQQLRKTDGLTLQDKIEAIVVDFPEEHKEMIMKAVQAVSLEKGESLSIKKV